VKPDCVRVGLGEPRPMVSIVMLLCDFDDKDQWGICSTALLGLRESAPHDAEIILVVNKSSDMLRLTVDQAVDRDGRIRVIYLSHNCGVVAKNLGYELAQGTFIFSIDSDVVVRSPDVFKRCLKFMEAHPEVALVGPCGGKIVKELWEKDKWPIGNWDGMETIYGYSDPVDFGTLDPMDGALVDAIPSLFWCFRRSVIEQVGALDWRYGPFVGSDSDFCFRLKEQGHKIAVLRVPVTHHGGGGSSHKEQGIQLDTIRLNHLVQLYEQWFPKVDVIREPGTPPPPVDEDEI